MISITSSILHLQGSLLNLNVRKIIPYEDVTNIVIEYDIQTVIKFYKGEEIIKELNHVEFNEKQLLGRLEHFNYPVEVKHLLD